MIIDISWPITPNITTYKDGAKPELTEVCTFEQHAARSSRLTMGLHTGTHIDAPSHFLESGKTVEHIALKSCMGACQVIDLTEYTGAITAEILAQFTLTQPRVLLKTRNSVDPVSGAFNREFVYLSHDAAQHLAQQRVRESQQPLVLVGIDALGIERNQPNHETHTILFDHDIVILEGLRLAHVKPGEYELIALPIALVGPEAAPVRAILRSSGTLRNEHNF